MPEPITKRPYKVPESVLVVIHTPALDVLMLERADHPGYWQSVTGSRDHADEALLETCVREVAEETGIDVRSPGIGLASLCDWGVRNVYEIYTEFLHRYASGVTHNTEHVFSLTVPPGTPVRLSPREHLALRWLPWQEAAAACFSPSNAAAIRELPHRAAAAAAAEAGREV